MHIPRLDLSDGQLAVLDVLGILATVAAAFLAAGAIIQSGRQAKRSALAIHRERRIDFELEVLEKS